MKKFKAVKAHLLQIVLAVIMLLGLLLPGVKLYALNSTPRHSLTDLNPAGLNPPPLDPDGSQGGIRPELLYEVKLIARRSVNGESLADATIRCTEEGDPGYGLTVKTKVEPITVRLLKEVIYTFKPEINPTDYQCWGHHEVQCKFVDGKFWIKGTVDSQDWTVRTKQEVEFLFHKEWPVLLGKEAEDAPDVQQEGARLQFGWPGDPDHFVGSSGPREFPKQLLVVEGIPYTFSELAAPSGYEKAGDIVFALNERGAIRLLSGEARVTNREAPNVLPPLITMVNRKAAGLVDQYEITVIAKRMVNDESLAGASIRYYDLAKPEYVKAVMTESSGAKISLEAGKTYSFEEVSAPLGYECWGPNPLECTLDASGNFMVRDPKDTLGWKKTEPRELFFRNYKQRLLSLSLVAEESPTEQLSGAQLQFGWPGAPDAFVGASGAPNFPKTFEIVEQIPYTFRELSAPAAYVKAEDIVFHLDEHNMIIIESGDGYMEPSTPLAAPPVLVMRNKRSNPHAELYSIDLIAKRMVNGKELAGAKVEYYDLANPSFIMDCETTTAPFPIQLKQGLVYRFEQVAPPEGYEFMGSNPLECMLDQEGRFLVRGSWTDAKWEEKAKKEIIFSNYKKQRILLSKSGEDDPHRPLSGAKMQFGWPGAPDWFVGDSGSAEFKKVFDIVEGIPYTLTELEAPSGYEIHEPIVFHLDEEGAIVIEKSEATVYPDSMEACPMLIMIDKKKGGETTTTTTTAATSVSGTTTTAVAVTTTTAASESSSTSTMSSTQTTTTSSATAPQLTRKTTVPTTRETILTTRPSTTPRSKLTLPDPGPFETNTTIQDKPDHLDAVDRVMKYALYATGTGIVGIGAYYGIKFLLKRRK